MEKKMFRKVVDLVQKKYATEGFTWDFRQGASAEEIELANQRLQEEHDIELPEQFIDFLKDMNGFEVDGKIMYGVDQEFLKNGDEIDYFEGIADNNLSAYDNDWDERYVFLGEDSLNKYVYNMNDGKYYQIDSGCGDVYEVFSSFEEVLKCQFKSELEY